MKRFLILAVAVALLPGCAANFGFQFGSTGKSATQPTVGPGGSFSSGGVIARFGEAANSGSLLGVGLLGFLFGGEPRANDERTPPALDSNRLVNEQDCGKILENPSANLRCR